MLRLECHRWLFRRSIVVDGNFHADHLKMKHPEDDVALSDGCAFMVKTEPYQEHLSESKDMKQVCFARCHSYSYRSWKVKLEIGMQQLQGHEFGQLKSKKQRCHRYRSVCLRTTWLFYPPGGGRLSKGGEVCLCIIRGHNIY